jgi:hypothetical protein
MKAIVYTVAAVLQARDHETGHFRDTDSVHSGWQNRKAILQNRSF